MLLAVDTSTRWIGLAIHTGTAVMSEQIWLTRDRHTVELASAVERLLEQTGVSATQLKILAIATGPGSFTSLRIGLAFTKGLAFAMKIPLIGIPSLDIQAEIIPLSEKPLFAVLQAGRGRLAVVRYQSNGDSWKSISQPAICDLQGLFGMMEGASIVAGELDEEQRHALSDRRKPIHLAAPAQCLRRPSVLAELALMRYEAGQLDDPLSLAPIYVHVAEPIPD